MPSLSVDGNIFLGGLSERRVLGRRVVDRARLVAEPGRLLHEMGLDIDPRGSVARLSVGRQQVVEIVNAMSFAPSILLDEPPSALAAREVELLFTPLRRLRAGR